MLYSGRMRVAVNETADGPRAELRGDRGWSAGSLRRSDGVKPGKRCTSSMDLSGVWESGVYTA